MHHASMTYIATVPYSSHAGRGASSVTFGVATPRPVSTAVRVAGTRLATWNWCALALKNSFAAGSYATAIEPPTTSRFACASESYVWNTNSPGNACCTARTNAGSLPIRAIGTSCGCGAWNAKT